MEIYQPTWDEKDRPRVRCPNYPVERRITIGSDFCHKECPHLEAVLDWPDREQIHCVFPENGAKKTVKLK